MVITGLGVGGAERQVCDLADRFSSRGHLVRVFYLLKPALVRPRSDQVEVVWLGGNRSILGILKAFRNFIKYIKEGAPDIVHSHMYHANIFARISRLFSNIPRLVCTAHSTDEGGKLRMLAYRLTNFLGDIFTNVSVGAVRAFEAKRAVQVGGMIAVHNGVNVDHFVFSASCRDSLRKEYGLEDKNVFISIGRFHQAKDYPNLISAFEQVACKHPKSHLLIVGDGEQRDIIEFLIANKGLSEKIDLLGIRNDIPALLSAADVYVMSSAWEGFGLVIAEAMAVERLVVATDCGGVAEVLGEQGFLVKPQDSSALGAAMGKALMLDKKESYALGYGARLRILGNYSLQSVVERWEAMYNNNNK